MALTSEEISALVQECAPLVEGARIENVHQDGRFNVYLTLYSQASGKLSLLLATRPRFQRFCLTEERPPAPAAPPHFCEAARSVLRGGRVERLRQVSGDRILEIAASRKTETGRAETASLVLEMIGGRGQLVLVDSQKRVIASLHLLRRGGAEISPGDPYRFPEPRAQNPQIKALGPISWRYLDEADAPPLDSKAPLSFATARRYGRLEAEEELRERREALLGSLRRTHSHAAELASKVREDLRAAEAGKEHLERGELLKSALGRLKRGMESIEIENFFAEGLPRVRIDLDPALSPQQNLEKHFKRYQKTRRALPVLAERLTRLEAQAAQARKLLDALEGAPSVEELARIESAAEGLQRKRPPARSKGPKVTRALGPRRFTSLDGMEVLVGRNAKQNDELTLKMARGNDVFLHVAGRAGGHVIIRSAEGKQVPLETLLDGAQLALYYSLSERQRSGPGLHAAGEIDYTQVKHIRKPKGARPGLVLLSTHKSLRVRIEPERLARLQDTARDGAGN